MSTIENTSFSRLLRISSKQRNLSDFSQHDCDFRVDLSKIVTQESNIKRIVLKSISLPNFFYNISSVTFGGVGNNVFAYRIFDGVSTHTDHNVVLSGQYTFTELAAVLKLDIDGNLTAGTVSIDANAEGKIIFSMTGTGAQQLIIYEGGEQNGAGTVNTMGQTLGLTGVFDGGNGVTDTISYTGESIIDLSGISRFYIRSKVLGRNNLYDGNSIVRPYISGEIPLSARVQFGSYLHWEPFDDELSSKNYRTIKNLNEVLDIQLVDIKDNIIQYGSGNPNIEDNAEVIIVFKIYY